MDYFYKRKTDRISGKFKAAMFDKRLTDLKKYITV